MTEQFKGTVQFVNAREVRGMTLHSFKLKDTDFYNNCGTDDPSLVKGDYITYEGDTKPDGNVRVNLRSIKKEKAEVASTPKAKADIVRRAVIGSMGKDTYWENKEVRDIEVQKTIQLQASRNAAIALASSILQAGAVAGYEKAKPADKMDLITSLVDLLTDRFQQQVADSKNLADVSVEVPSEPETLSEQTDENSQWE